MTTSTLRTESEKSFSPTTGRAIPAWLAPIIEHFELNGKQLVTLKDIEEARPDLSHAMAMLARAHLLRLGWLQPIGARGSYEFMPGAAAGPYPSGDPWLPLRALLAKRAIDVHVGGESAAWLLGYAQRSPERHVLVVAPQTPVPQSLRRSYQVLETAPAPAHGTIDGLPVPTSAELFAEVAQLAPRLRLNTARTWIGALLADTAPKETAAELARRGPAARARAGYFCRSCGAEAHADAIAALGPIGRGPYYTGSRGTAAPFSPEWRVYDTGRFAA
jgi:hypothetical protein